MLGSLRKTLLISVALLGLSGCVTVGDTPAPTVSGKEALDALARGDYRLAETQAATAVRMHPNDPYALIALALTYELTGRPLQARDYYKVVEALNPDGTVVLNDGIERRLIDVARVRLAALSTPAPEPRGPMVTTAQAWDAVANRFLTLRRLVQAGLATEGEYSERRRANAGALLPYSEAPAAIGLDQPPPPYETVVQRLQSINKALEDRAINPPDHAVERVAILDGLLPVAPRERVPGTPGLDPLVAPAYMAHLRKLQAAGLISGDEAARERAAAERIAGPSGLPGASAGKAAPTMAKAPAKAAPAAHAGGGRQHGVHLASFGSEAKARESWEQLRRKFPDLTALQPRITRADLGAKGVFFRLSAGPVASAKAAGAVCAKLKAAGQYCAPTRF